MSSQESNQGLIQLTSVQSFEKTYQLVRDVLENNPKIGILAEVDHSSNAKRVGLKLPKTKLILFGNPNLGTPLMQSSRTIAIDLPQKILVWEDTEGKVFLTYNDPNYLLKRHHITNKDDIAELVSKALSSISQKATQ
ncbi:DUF302 domain-containing protein [Flagellimonas onchidii]|uniref:DUF302 domain-containing protein n=1 Tax=Flagellimonas onchidii TaxID=2562684 RepID=UPI0010A6489E|nr:DUF302 domain-containing protein [Allomuricauda onchidii]